MDDYRAVIAVVYRLLLLDQEKRLWVHAASGVKRLRVAYRVGMAADWNGVPEMLRHGIVRLAAQYYLRRGETGEIEVPAAVTALWRPWRRLRLR